MNSPYRQAAEYIDQHIKANIPENTIRNHFLQYGWTKENIEQAFDEYRKLIYDGVQHHIKNNMPAKYTLTSIVSDTYKAIIRNRGAYAVSIGLTSVALIAALEGLFHVIPLGLPAVAILLLIVLCYVPVHVCQSFIFAIMTVLLQAFYDNRTVRPMQPLMEGFKVLRRIALTNLLWNMISYAPIIIGGWIVVYAVFLTLSPMWLIVVPLLALISIVWVLIVGLRYCLSPVVAQCEPSVPIRQILPRSRKLLGPKGQWVVVLGAVVSMIIGIPIYQIESSSLSIALPQFVCLVLLVSFMFGGLSAVYFNVISRERKT